MHASSVKSSFLIKPNKYRPTAKQSSGYEMFSLKMALLSFLFFFLIMSSISVSTSPVTKTSVTPESDSVLSQDSNVVTYSIQENVPIVEGDVGTYRGFAYHVRDTDIVYFVDPIQDVSFQVAVPDGSTPGSLKGVDIDDDGSTEFMFAHRATSSSTYELVVVDFDTLSYTTNYDIPNWYHIISGIGDFNADGKLDLYLKHNGNMYHTILDVAANSTIGQWNTSTRVGYQSVGRYHDGAKDYLALGIQNVVYRNISIFDGFGNLINQVDHVYIKDIDTINHGDIAEDLVVTDYYGNATVYHGENLTAAYKINLRGVATSNFFVQSGNITLDEYEDFYAIERYDEQAYMVDGRDGTLLHTVNGVVTGTFRAFDLGEIDADERTDALIKDVSGSPGLLRGVDGVVSYVETLIENPYQFIVHEVTGDSKEDMMLRVITDVGSDIYIIKSDTEAPILTPSPMNPLHPTVIDDFITVEVSVDDSSPIDMTLLRYREVGESIWIEPHDGLFSTTDGITHFAFLVGLDGGNYEYYIQFRDTFLNIGEIGNPSTPETFSVQGNLVWETEPIGDTLLHHYTARNRIAEGNMTDGSRVIYVAKGHLNVNVTLSKYDEHGVFLDSATLPFTNSYDFALLSGNFDGDGVTDPVVLISEKSPDAYAYVFHGNNFSINYISPIPIFAKEYEHQQVYDVDDDNLDELVMVTVNEPLSLGIMDNDGTWSSRLLPFSDQGQWATDAMAIGQAAIVADTHIAIERNANLIEIFRTSDLTQLQAIIPNYGSYTDADIVDIEVFHNASRSTIQFLVEFRLWDGSDPYTAFAFLDAYTSSIDVADMYIVPDRVHRYGHVHDVDADGTDEMFAITIAGEISLIQFDQSLTIDWTSTMTDATPTVSLVTDFLGDGTDQLAIFTNEDERLTIIDFNGMVHRNLYVGEVHGAFEISSVDAGNGNEIAAFPIVKDGDGVLGAVRDLDWYYRLNVSVEFAPTLLNQTQELYSEVSVTNIYDELIEDATVNINVHYFFEEETMTYTDGYFYNDSSLSYQTRFDVTWPIGVANVSIMVGHNFYHSWFSLYPDALTITSPLHVEIHTPEVVAQGEDQIVEVWVRDTLGTTVTDANVTITIASGEFSPTLIEPFYVYDNENVTLPAGDYEVLAEAQHTFATTKSNASEHFRVQTITEDLVIIDDLPRALLQSNMTLAWFNITDASGFEISGADVSLRSGPVEFPMEELAPGCYRLSSPFDVVIGRHSFDLNVRKHGFENPVAATVNVTVIGELNPGIFFAQNVESEGSLFIEISMKDFLGPVTVGTSVTIEVGGENYTAIQHPEYLTEFNISIPINVGAGRNVFRVFSFASYASAVDEREYTFFVHGPVDVDVSSSLEWEIIQGNTTEISVNIADWMAIPVSVSSATLYIGTGAYTLSEVGSGFYSVTVSTAGWEPGIYNYSVFILDSYVTLSDPVIGELIVKGVLSFSIDVITENPRANSLLEIEVSVTDKYNNPVPGLDVSVEIAGMYAEVYATGEPGRYLAVFERAPVVGPVGWGYEFINVVADNEICILGTRAESFLLSSSIPDISMDVTTYGISAGFAFLLSILGLFGYFKLSSSMRIQETSIDATEKSVKRMDRLYIAIVGITGASALTSWVAYTAANYEFAVGFAITVLGSSILLYGIWLYRDSVASILVDDRINRKRMVLGLWHLFFLPVTIGMILVYGYGIPWFNEHIINDAFVVGDISIPGIITTVVTSFLSSILVVVFNVYRELSQGVTKLDKMEAAGTPQDVLADERSILVKKASSSIRVKFLLFLVVVGGATLLSIDFILSQYSILLIVIIPVLFLVIIPFISSKLLQAFGFMKSKVTSESTDTMI